MGGQRYVFFPKSLQLEVGARRVPRLLLFTNGLQLGKNNCASIHCCVHPEEKMGLVGWGGHCTGQEHLQRLLFKVSCHQLGQSISQSAYAILSLSLHTHKRKNDKASLYDHKQIKVFPLIKPLKGHKCWGSLFEGVFYVVFILVFIVFVAFLVFLLVRSCLFCSDQMSHGLQGCWIAEVLGTWKDCMSFQWMWVAIGWFRGSKITSYFWFWPLHWLYDSRTFWYSSSVTVCVDSA